MNARHGAAVAAVVVVLAAIVLVATWPEAGHPDDAHEQVDAGTALAPAVEPAAPEEPSPAVVPSLPAPPPPTSAPAASVVLVAPPSSGLAAPPSPVPPSYETSAGPRLTEDEAYDAANALVSAIEARRVEVAAALADAQRRGDARMVARLTQQRDGLTRSLERAESIVVDMDRDRGASAAPPPSTATDPADGP